MGQIGDSGLVACLLLCAVLQVQSAQASLMRCGAERSRRLFAIPYIVRAGAGVGERAHCYGGLCAVPQVPNPATLQDLSSGIERC